MIRTRSLCFALAIMVSVILVTLLVIPPSTATAGESRMIQILGREAPIIEPPILQIEKGTTVVWFNDAKAELKVTFEDGKKCDDVTEAASAFSLDAKNCYVTTWLPFGATSSLRFTEAGTFEYIVDFAGMKKPKRARIIVK